ncbi:MAG: prenyltransferase, partial [Candidatus Promineifilaceae bacterium]
PGLVAAGGLAPLPLGLWLAGRVAAGAWADPSQWERLAFWSIGLLMATAGAELAAFVSLI